MPQHGVGEQLEQRRLRWAAEPAGKRQCQCSPTNLGVATTDAEVNITRQQSQRQHRSRKGLKIDNNNNNNYYYYDDDDDDDNDDDDDDKRRHDHTRMC